ncbi:MAG: hypothetical protein ACI9WC_001344 [Arenicella sp.]|jgi:hypothetical protein
MAITLSHDDFKVDVLSNRALALVSEFALILYLRNGTFIDVDSSDVLLRLFENATRCEDHRLRKISLHIKTELGISIVNSKARYEASNMVS